MSSITVINQIESKQQETTADSLSKAQPYAWCCGVDTNEAMIGCDASTLTMSASGCTEWYHLSCVGLAHLKEEQIQNMEWKCLYCIKYLSQSVYLSAYNKRDLYESEDESSSQDVIFEGLNEQQISKMRKIMKSMQNKYNECCRKERQIQIKEAQQLIAFHFGITVNDNEAAFIIEYAADNHQNLEEQLQNEGLPFLQSMQEMMKQSKLVRNTNNIYNRIRYDNKEMQIAKRVTKRKNVAKNTNLDGSARCSRLLLNDALQNTLSMDGWSAARMKAWKNRHKQSNAYFYRFNVPGQPQRNGKWSKSEHRVFMHRVLSFGVNDQWGIFSQCIPGRVGYQCSNYWRGLVKDGDVTDPNYHYDGKKLHFKRNTKTFSISTEYRRYAITVNRDISGIWSNLPAKHPLHPSVLYCKSVDDALGCYGEHGWSVNNTKKRHRQQKDKECDDRKPLQKKRRKNKRNMSDDDDAYYCKASISRRKDDNPMPDFIDQMTGNAVVKPTISPYGHVLGYETWSKILRSAKHKDICPFTLQKLTRRALVKLTKENYNEYKDKIINITQQQKDLLTTLNQE